MIFGLSGATGDAARSAGQRVLQLQSQAAESGTTTDSSSTGIDGNPTSADESGSINLSGSAPAPSNHSPSLYLS